MAAVKLFRKPGSTTSWREGLRRLAGTGAPPLRTAFSAGVGFAVGMLPIAPFQTLLVLGLAFALRLNRVVAFAGSLIWQPFTAPIILGAEYAAGTLVLRGFGGHAAGSAWVRYGLPVAVGAAVLAPCACLLGFGITYGFLRARSRQKGSPSVQEGGRP